MSRSHQFIVLVAVFMLIFSTGGAGQPAAAAPLSMLIRKTAMTQPSEIFASSGITDNVLIPAGPLEHYWFATNNVSVVVSAPVKFPKGKVARWVKAWVTDNSGGTDICIQPFYSSPGLNTATKLGASACSSGSSGLLEVLKSTFSQKVKGSNFIGVYVSTARASHQILGFQGGFVK